MIFNHSKFNEHWNTRVLSELGNFRRGKSRHRPRNDKALFENGRHPLVQTGEIRAANLYIRSHTDTYNDFGISTKQEVARGNARHNNCSKHCGDSLARVPDVLP